MFRLYKTAPNVTANDISNDVIGMSPFSYRTNVDFTFELPELKLTSPVEYAQGTKLFLVEEADTHKQVCFYVKKREYDYKTHKWTYTCPHVFDLLADIYAQDVPTSFPSSSWSDITPSYQQFNNEMADWANQGDYVWERCYWQCIFLIKMMIKHITGTGINSIDSTDIDELDSPYTSRVLMIAPSYYEDYPIKYKNLGINSNCAVRMGTNKTLDYASDDFWVYNTNPSCLQMLRWICSSLKIMVNIFRDDYRFEVLELSGLPDNDADAEYTEEVLEPYRAFAVEVKYLDGGSYQWQFGHWVDSVYVPYYFGEEPNDREIATDKYTAETATVYNTRSVSVSFPNFYRVFALSILGGGAGGSGYQSHVYAILNAQTGTTETLQHAEMLKAWWEDLTMKTKCEIALTGLDMAVPYVEIDVEANRKRLEVLK